MEQEHYIEWIELRTKDMVFRKYLKPGDAPEAVFPTTEEEFIVLEHCNLHGLWKT
ncbi:desulfoferrodoxin, partial [Candidatus Woesearchaeota archaeon]|nr:desulfoferrodoxin [Candidatus Woesearchaeota archaeon]